MLFNIAISFNIYKRCKYCQDKLVSKLVMFPVSVAGPGHHL